MWIVSPGQSRRKRRAESDAEWNDVVVRYPLAQLEQRLTDGRLRVRRFENCFGLSLERADVAHANADTDLPAIAKRDDNPRPDYDRIREPFFYCVCEILEQREGQRDFDEPGTLLTHLGTPWSDPHSVRAMRPALVRPTV